MAEDWKKRIFIEKSLWEVYRLSRTVLPKPKSNRTIFWLFAAMFLGLFVWGVYDGGTRYAAQDGLKFLRFAAVQGMSLAIGILGFLIAGFAIFASVTRAELFIALANIPYKKNGTETGINRLQFVFFNFMNVFTVYIGLLAVCMAVVIGLSEDSPIVQMGAPASAWCPKLLTIAIFLSFGLLGLWIVSALLKLKSFIWNLYQTVLVTIATEAEIEVRRKASKQGGV